MSPLGLGDELRAALVTPAGCCGYLCLHRAGRLPAAVYAVAARLQSIDRRTARPGAVPTVRVPSTTGGWLLLHASHLNSSAGGDIAVIIEPAHPGNAAPLLLSAQRLTPANATLRCSCCAAHPPRRSRPNCTYRPTPSKTT